jgi:serine/threonine protein kinase/Tol biopolymer transport system component
MIGETILHYKIIEKLGEGGMGEVYKAQDTKLDRFVALKFLPSQMTASEDDKARFIQEAKAASAMNHPNVCTIYDIQDNNGQLFIVMEYVDGKTLKDKKNSISEKQILEIGIQVAEGLAAAHEKGIVHRDIKPENIMVRKDGIAQIMDFGLAKLRETSGVSRLTKAGTTMGTMGYMSPEQVQGLDVDHRTDIFSLGVVLYEMLAGESPFKGVHETAIMYEIVNVDPTPISSLKENVDSELDKLIFDCLEKDKEERLQSAKELARNLRRFKRGSTGSRASKVFQTRSFSSKEAETLKKEPIGFYSKAVKYLSKNKINTTIILLLSIAVIILGLSKILSNSVSNINEPIRFTFDIPGKSNPILFWPTVLAISPDGQSIAYVDESLNPNIIKIRNLNSFESYAVRGTENSVSPAFVNNNIIGFTSNQADNWAMKVQITGGVPDQSHAFYGDGYGYGSDGSIISTQNWGSGIFYQKGWNDTQKSVTEIDASKNEGSHLYPYMLPGNKAAVFTIWSKDGTFDDSKIGLINLKTKEEKILNYNGVNLQGTKPKFISTSWGNFILYSHSGNLYASLFDLSSLSVIGPEIKILDGISVNSQNGNASYVVSTGNNGTIAYIPGRIDTTKSNLVWMDRNSNEKKAISMSGPYLSPSLYNSSKGLILLTGSVYKIGLMDLNNNKVSILFDKGDNNLPMITPDGLHYIFVSNFEDGKYNIYLSRLDGIGGAKKIVATEGGYPYTSNLSPDGKFVLFTIKYQGQSKIWIKNITTNKKPEILFKSDATLREPKLSPNGKLVAYRSDEIEGKFKLFIRALPINKDKIQVSADDGLFACWSNDSKEIYYRDGDKIMVAKIELQPKLKVVSRTVACISPRVSSTSSQCDFTVGPDGRILALRSAIDQSKPIKVKVIVNWFSELENKLKNQD